MKEILKNIPSSWAELKLKDYNKLFELGIKVDEGEFTLISNNSLKAFSILSGLSIEELEDLPITAIGEINNRLSFLQTLPEPKAKSKLKWKKIDEVPYGAFIAFVQAQSDPLKSIHLILKEFSLNKLTEDEILDLTMDEVYTGFFLFQTSVNKSSKRIIFRLVKRLGLKIIKESLKGLIRFKQNLKNIKKD